jgi:hypothetical protein
MCTSWLPCIMVTFSLLLVDVYILATMYHGYFQFSVGLMCTSWLPSIVFTFSLVLVDVYILATLYHGYFQFIVG